MNLDRFILSAKRIGIDCSSHFAFISIPNILDNLAHMYVFVSNREDLIKIFKFHIDKNMTDL